MATHSGDRSQYFKSAAEIDDQLSNIEENKGYAGTPCIRCVHAGQCYIKCVHIRSYPVQEVRTRRYTMQGPRPATLASRLGGASTQCTHFKAEKKHVGVSCVVSSRWFSVSMVSAHRIVPCFGEDLAYIKQRSSFGLCTIFVEYLLVRSSPDL